MPTQQSSSARFERLLARAEPVPHQESRDDATLQRRHDAITARVTQAMAHKSALTRQSRQRVDNALAARLQRVVGDVVNVDVVRERAGVTPKDIHHPTPPPSVTTTTTVEVVPPVVHAAPCRTTAYHTLGFPICFAHSGFHSVLRWAEVSLEETHMAAFGPRAAPVRGAMPHRLLVTVACYVLNEILTRESTWGTLWGRLREFIFDAVFAPRLIPAERDAAPSPTACAPHAAKSETWTSPLPRHTATYDSVDDYACHVLWTEEVGRVRRCNAALARRVTALRAVVQRVANVLARAQRRLDHAWQRRVFTLWRTHTARTAARHRTLTAYLVHRRERALEDVCFLRWRRATLQGKIAVLHQERQRLDHTTHMTQQVHRLELANARAELAREQEMRQVMEVQHAAAQAQAHESHRLETQALNYALTRQRRRACALERGVRRWTRVARTFRPHTLCTRPPPALLRAGAELKVVEEELGWGRVESYGRVVVRRGVTSLLEGLVLQWVSHVLHGTPHSASRRDVAWTRLARPARGRNRDVVDDGVFTNATLRTLLYALQRRYGVTIEDSARADGDTKEGLFELLCAVLYITTDEGLHPCLLSHCPYIRHFFTPAVFDDVVPRIAMLWILLALFCGDVERVGGIATWVPLRWPRELQGAHEGNIAARVGTALAIPMSELELQAESTAMRVVGQHLARQHNARRRSSVARPSLSRRGTATSRPSSASGRRRSSAQTPTGRRARRRARRRVGWQLCDAELVRDGVDAVADLEVYLGVRPEWVPREYSTHDVDALLRDAAVAETRAMRRRLRSDPNTGSELDDSADSSCSTPCASRGGDSNDAQLDENDEEEDEVVDGEDALRMQSEGTLETGALTARQRRLLAQLPRPSTAFDVPTCNDDDENDDDDDARARVRRARRVALHTFIRRSVLDLQRRRQWLGLGRLVRSLVLRFRVLDYGVPAAWQRTRPRSQLVPSSDTVTRPPSHTPGRHTPEVRTPSSLPLVVTETEPSRVGSASHRNGSPNVAHVTPSSSSHPTPSSHAILSSHVASPSSHVKRVHVSGAVTHSSESLPPAVPPPPPSTTLPTLTVPSSLLSSAITPQSSSASPAPNPTPSQPVHDPVSTPPRLVTPSATNGTTGSRHSSPAPPSVGEVQSWPAAPFSALVIHPSSPAHASRRQLPRFHFNLRDVHRASGV